MFTTRAAGAYEFNASFITNGNRWLELNLIKNAELIVKGHCHMSFVATGTINVILRLRKGDRVFLRHPRFAGLIYGHDFSMFCGHML